MNHVVCFLGQVVRVITQKAIGPIAETRERSLQQGDLQHLLIFTSFILHHLYKNGGN